jgi:hypothetical protein
MIHRGKRDDWIKSREKEGKICCRPVTLSSGSCGVDKVVAYLTSQLTSRTDLQLPCTYLDAPRDLDGSL